MLMFALRLVDLLVSTTASQGPPNNGEMARMHYYGYGWGWWLIVIFFWVFVIMGIVTAFRLALAGGSTARGAMRGTPSSEAREDSALRILKERYARGEIDKQEFEEKKEDLMQP